MGQQEGLSDALQNTEHAVDRKSFIKTAGGGIIAGSVLGGVFSPVAAQVKASKRSPGKGSPAKAAASLKTELPPLEDKSEKPKGPLPAPAPEDSRVGYAIVGLGQLSLEAIMPAFAHSKYAKPVALVSGDQEKALKVAKQYGIPETGIYNYTNYDDIKNNPEIEAVFIVLPNSMHEEYTIRAAKAGKHVLCEKPMANTVAEAQRMTDACKEAGKKLMIAYRIQYDPRHRLVQKWLRSEQWGKVKLLDMVNAQNIGDPKQWRLKKALAGGGSLPDIGLYCLNTARFLTGEEPERVVGFVHSTPGDVRFKEVEETVLFQLHFPSGTLANCATHYGIHEARRYRCYGSKGGWFGLDPAFSYKGLKIERAEVTEGIELKSNVNMADEDQFAAELDHFALCIREDRTPYTPGEEGLQDMRIMEAIYRSATEGRPVDLKGPDFKASGKTDAFRGWKGDDEK